jgi:hypothetical protein
LANTGTVKSPDILKIFAPFALNKSRPAKRQPIGQAPIVLPVHKSRQEKKMKE